MRMLRAILTRSVFSNLYLAETEKRFFESQVRNCIGCQTTLLVWTIIVCYIGLFLDVSGPMKLHEIQKYLKK